MQAALLVKCPILLPDFNQIWYLSNNFRKSHKYLIPRQSDHWEPRWYTRTKTDRQTEGHCEGNRRFSQVCKLAYKSLLATKIVKTHKHAIRKKCSLLTSSWVVQRLYLSLGCKRLQWPATAAARMWFKTMSQSSAVHWNWNTNFVSKWRMHKMKAAK